MGEKTQSPIWRLLGLLWHQPFMGTWNMKTFIFEAIQGDDVTQWIMCGESLDDARQKFIEQYGDIFLITDIFDIT
jgi:hypothetical protein